MSELGELVRVGLALDARHLDAAAIVAFDQLSSVGQLGLARA